MEFHRNIETLNGRRIKKGDYFLIDHQDKNIHYWYRDKKLTLAISRKVLDELCYESKTIIQSVIKGYTSAGDVAFERIQDGDYFVFKPAYDKPYFWFRGEKVIKEINKEKFRFLCNISGVKPEDVLLIYINEDEEMREKDSKIKSYAALAMEEVITVGVQFNQSSRTYTYKALKDWVEVGDLAVVETNSEFKIVEVTEVHDVPQIDVDSDISYKWIVDKIDKSAYEKVLDVETKIVEALLKERQKNVRANARQMLADSLGISVDNITKALADNSEK